MITSMANQRIRRLIQLQEKGKLRNKEGVFVGEGLKMFEEAPMEYLEEVYCQTSLWQQLKAGKDQVSGKTQVSGIDRASGQDQVRRSSVFEKLLACEKQGILVEEVADDVLKKAADTQAPQGILFVIKQLPCSLQEMLEGGLSSQKKTGRAPLFLLAEDIQDPGNLGTMIRTAEGAGAAGVILSRGTVDIYNPKTIRSTMGSLYRVPHLYIEDLKHAISVLQQAQITVYAAHLDGKQYFDEIAYERGSAFLIGNEGKGLKKETADCADVYVKIPMEGKLESLNAGVAASLFLYHAYRYGKRQ